MNRLGPVAMSDRGGLAVKVFIQEAVVRRRRGSLEPAGVVASKWWFGSTGRPCCRACVGVAVMTAASIDDTDIRRVEPLSECVGGTRHHLA